MDWILILLFCIALYTLIAYYVHEMRLWQEHIVFYGPIMAVKTNRVGFFDKFTAIRTFFRIYGTVGVIAVIIVSVLITLMLFVSVRYTLLIRPEPTGIYEPQNILLLPGVNQYVPSTLAVWLAFVITIGIHEFGHAILCRVEDIRVKGMGVLIAVIPIGFFVEPDEEDLEKTKGMPKARMFGAGITNNLVFGFACFALLILAMGMVVPAQQPVIYGIYKNHSAESAGVPADSMIRYIGIGNVTTAENSIPVSIAPPLADKNPPAYTRVPVSSREQVAMVLNATRPGDRIVLGVEKDGVVKEYALNLSSWPAEAAARQSGFMGITYYDGALVKSAVRNMFSPVGFFQFLVIPFGADQGTQFLRIIAFDTPDTRFYQVPFAGFWGVIHLLFWCAWININVGIFNAIPMVPLDGGYIFKEGVDRLLDRRGMIRYSGYVVSAVSYVMIMVLMSLILLPYLMHL